MAPGATIEPEDRKLSEQVLSWGREKGVSNGTKKIGRASLEFGIDVEP